MKAVYVDCLCGPTAGMSVDGDLQGVPRIQSALSAHMWPGLVMKPANKLTDASAASPEDDKGPPMNLYLLCSVCPLLQYLL